MTDQPAPTAADVAPPAAAAGEDRILPGLVYVLYLVGLANGVTILLGLILAYLMKGSAGPKAATHYDFIIRTFWMSIGWFAIGALLALFGGILSIILIGIPALMLGIFIMGAVGIWFAVRCVLGLVYLGKEEAYPRPNTWLV
jgi:uncharacterized membrane protein